MVAVTYPGVYIQEVSSGVQTITGVSTSTALFIGRTERGVINKPTRVFNYSDFSRMFGTSTTSSELPTSVRLFFANGGNQAYIMRVAHDALTASVTLKNNAEDEVLTLTAREAGVRGGELRVAVDYNTATPDTTFNLLIFRVDPNTLQESELESHTNLSMEPGTARYVVDVLAQDSKLVTATDESMGPSAFSGYTIGARIIPGVDAAAIEAVVPDGSTIVLEVNGVTHADVVSNANFGDIATDAGCSYAAVNLESDTHCLIKFSKTGGKVRVLPSDVYTLLQFGPEQGGIEFLPYSERRPAQSGVRYEGYSNITKIPKFGQGDYKGAGVKLIVGTTDVAGYNLVTTAADDLFFEGNASDGLSIRNVREKLDILASQFNANVKNLPNVNWRLEIQGLNLVFRATSGNANAGLGTVIDSLPTALIGDDGFKLGTTDNTRYYMLGAGGAGDFQAGTAGTDGSPPDSGDYDTAYEIIDREVDIFNILVLPRDTDVSETDRKNLWGPASVFCQKRRAFVLVDPPRTWQTVADVTGAINSMRIGLVKDHAGLYWPPLIAVNENGLQKTFDASGAIAGVMARTDANRGVWKAPAGLEADIRGITGVVRAISNDDNGVINSLGINAVRVFPNGIVAWGARTVDGFDNSGNSDYKYVPVRRFALFLGESLYRGLQFAVFEPNAEPLWAQIRLAAGAFMNGLFRQGAFQGQKKSEAYFVKVDAETTTQNDINLGIVNVIVGFAPLKPAEFVIIHLKQIAGQIQT